MYKCVLQCVIVICITALLKLCINMCFLSQNEINDESFREKIMV